MGKSYLFAEEIVRVIRDCLREGTTVELDGLGTFLPAPDGAIRFEASKRTKVFLSYASEDQDTVERFHQDLATEGFDVWLDRHNLLPGQNWPRAIEHAINVADFFIPCFSSRSVNKRGHFQAEVRYALDCLSLIPPSDTFILPVRLDPCSVPLQIQRELHYVDLFPDWDRGIQRIVKAMRLEMRERQRRR